MLTQDLLLKTAFCCMACDGDIASDEIDLLQDFTKNDEAWKGFDVQAALNKYIISINENGTAFLGDYLKEVENAGLGEEDSLKVVSIAIRMIEADNKVEYSEIRFFKRIRQVLPVSDDSLYAHFPGKDDFFLPDFSVPESIDWNAKFEAIEFKA